MFKYLDRIQEECEQYRFDAGRTVKDLSELALLADYSKKASHLASSDELNKEETRRELQEKFNRIQFYSEKDKKMIGPVSKKFALTAFTNDTIHSEIEKKDNSELKALSDKLKKLEDMVNRISNSNEEGLNEIMLKGLENISGKLDNVMLTHENHKSNVDVDTTTKVRLIAMYWKM